MGVICEKQAFREPDTSGPTEFLNRTFSADEVQRLSPIERFELTMPFHLMRVDAYEGKIKRLVYSEDNGTLTFEQLCFAFERNSNWSDLKDPRSRLHKFFQHPLLRDEKQPHLLNVHRCILLGIVLCNGDDKLKARVLYDVL
jgi:hypothetical protein